MTTLFAANYANQNARTQGEMKVVFETLRSVLAETLGGSAEVTLQLTSDAITPNNNACQIVIDSQSAGANDNCQTITATNCRDGQLLLLRCSATNEQITIINNGGGAGQIATADAANFTLKDPKQFIIVKYNASLGSGTWEEVFRSYANQKADFRTYLGLGTAAVANTGNSTGNVPLAETVFDNVASQTANRVVASPNGSSGVLSVRALVAADLPTVTLAKGGLNFTTGTGNAKSILVGAGGSAYKEITGASAGQSIRVNSGNTDIEFYTPGNSTPFTSTDQTITQGGSYTLAHSLSSTPKQAWFALVCQTGEHGYSANDVVYCLDPIVYNVTIWLDATNLNARWVNNGVVIINRSTGAAQQALTNGNWKIRFFCI